MSKRHETDSIIEDSSSVEYGQREAENALKALLYVVQLRPFGVGKLRKDIILAETEYRNEIPALSHS